MTPSLAELIVADRMPSRPGARTHDEIEASTSTGRALHALEGVAFGGSQQAVYYCTDRDTRLSHDQRADAHVFGIERSALALLDLPDLAHEARELVYGILADVRGYRQADDAEDASAASGDRRVEQMHGVFKRIAGWVERSCVALRASAREAGR